jgi:hypothetical protein
MADAPKRPGKPRKPRKTTTKVPPRRRGPDPLGQAPYTRCPFPGLPQGPSNPYGDPAPGK